MEDLQDLLMLTPRKVSANGTVLLGDVQELYKAEKKRYRVMGGAIHCIFCPLIDPGALREVKKEGILLPNDYIDFLKKYNGLNAYSDSFCLYGFGRIKHDGMYVTVRDPDVVLPYHIGDYKLKNESVFQVGTFCEQKIVFDVNNDRYSLLNKGGRAEKFWRYINEVISYCLAQLKKHYNNAGKVDEPLIIGNILFNKKINLGGI